MATRPNGDPPFGPSYGNESNAAQPQHDEADERYQALLSVMEQGFCIIEVAFDQDRKPTDYRFLEISPSFERQTGIQNAAGRWMRQIAPDQDKDWFEIYGRVAETGQAEHFENYSTPLGRWFSVHAVPIGRPERLRIAVVFTDISEHKRAEQNETALRENEELFELMIRSVQDHAIFIMDADGNIVRWNEGAQRILGYGPEEILGQNFSLFFIEKDRAAGMPARELKSAAESGRALDENWQLRKEGSRFWASGATIALRDQNGALRGFAKIFRDLTERKAADDALREKDLRLRAALLAGRMGTWHWDIVADHQKLDESLQQLLEVKPGDIVRNLDDFLRVIHADDRNSVGAAFHRSAHEGTTLDVEFRIDKPGEGIRWIRDRGEVVLGDDGRPRYLTGACVDITERKEMEEALRRADRRKDEFLAILAHELRNPLAPIRNTLRILKLTEAEGKAVHSAVDMMDDQVDHLVRLVDDLLDISRISRGKIELRREAVEVSVVVQKAVETVRPLYQKRQLVVQLPTKPLYLDADATRIVQVLGNLLHNAAKFTEEEGGRVRISVEHTDQQVLIRVSDNGVGIAADQFHRIFEMFAQVDTSLERATGGLGLGLTLVKNLVELHGGSVQVYSEGLGHGSEFTVCLPLAQEGRRPAAPSGSSIPEHAVERRAGPRRILVVDDNNLAANSLARLLQIEGYEADARYCGIDAVRAVDELDFDAVILDIGMPRMNGYDACRAIRSKPAGQNMILIALTGWGQESDIRRTKEAGFDAHIVKPPNPGQLIDVLESLWTSRHQTTV